MKEIAFNIYKIIADSNAYFLDLRQKMMIDTGNYTHRAELVKELGDSIGRIKHVILTHLHYDHVGNIELFENAAFYCSEEELENFKDRPFETVMDYDRVKVLMQLMPRFKPVKNMFGLKVISAPGHTSGSICIWHEKARILFSGDTLFSEGIGRTDLPTSSETRMEFTLKQLKKIKYKILCPGHDY